MAEDLTISKGTKAEQYQNLLPQLQGLLSGETDFVANMANTCAALKEQFGWLWVGFYVVKQDELVLGPFQGPVACTRIKKGRGVCGTCWQQEKTIVERMCTAFPAILPAAVCQTPRSLFRFVKMGRSWAFWMSIAQNMPILMMRTGTI